MMDAEMADAAQVADYLSSGHSGGANGAASNDITPLGPISRENSLPARVQDQLVLGAESDEEEDSSDYSEYSREVINQPPLPYSDLDTGLCYDARMRFHTELNPPSQRSDFHPEDPRRILAIYRTLCYAGLADDPAFRPKTALVRRPLKRIPTRHATKSEVSLVHEEVHFEFLKSTAGKFHVSGYLTFAD